MGDKRVQGGEEDIPSISEAVKGTPLGEKMFRIGSLASGRRLYLLSARCMRLDNPT